MTQADHFVDEDGFLLVVEACKQGFGRVGDTALIHRPVIEELGFVTHLLDDVVGRIALGTCNAQVEPVGAVMAEIVHGAVERGPVLLLLGREIQFGLDAVDVGITVGDDLFRRQWGRFLLGEHRRLLVGLRGLASLAWLRRTALPGVGRLRRRLTVSPGKNAGDARHDAHHPADRASEHAADGSRGLAPLFGASLDTLNHLRIHCQGRAQKGNDNARKHDAQFRARARRRCRADHYLVSMVESICWLRGWEGGTYPAPVMSAHYRFRTTRVYRPAVFPTTRKILPQEPVTPNRARTAAL